jgi:hypothetical protein
MKKRSVLGLLALIAVGVIIGGSALYRMKFRGAGPNGPTPDEMVDRLLEFDRNRDGQLSADEVPERMQGLFTRGDANQDAVLTKDELRQLAILQNEAAQRAEPNRRRE